MIASRFLKLRTETGVVDVRVNVFAPMQETSGSWSCCYEIGWPDGARAMNAAGADAMQALVIAVYMIGSEIYTSNYHKAGQLSWDNSGGGYGFPVPSSLRDLLVGDDKAFF